MTDGNSGEKTQCWPSLPMRSRQPKRHIFPQSFDNFCDEFLYSTGADGISRSQLGPLLV